jgi:phosphotransferase system  glucose/maltose/N-acetylglucosamine-specific IIC component
MIPFKKLIPLTLQLWLVAFGLHAQSYNISWYKVAGGGGVSTNATYQLSGTIGQPDASTQMTGGNYSVTGGFWALYAVQTPGAPLLTITYANNKAVVSWPSTVTGWMLQTNSNLQNANWVNYTGTVVNNTVTNSPAQGNLYFRLVNP